MRDHFLEGCGQSTGRAVSHSFDQDFTDVYHAALLSAIGCAVQGVATLQKTQATVRPGQGQEEGQEEGAATLSPQSLLHWAGGALFW
jgi:hypothetical protein